MPEIQLPKPTYNKWSRQAGGSPFIIQCPPTIIPGATITFIGESPGFNEVTEKKGFVGGSGNILWNMARAAGIKPEGVNRTNVCKRRPTGDNFGVFYHDPKERKHPTEELIFWQELLRREIAKYPPTVLVAAGDEALFSTTGLRGISKWRGSILQSTISQAIKVVPIMHPSWIMKMNWEWYYIGIKDLKKVKLLSEGADLSEPEPIFTIGPSFGEANEFLARIAHFNTFEWNIDIETRGDTITCFALSTDKYPDQAICIPIQTTQGPYWSEAEERHLWMMLQQAFKLNPYCLNQNLCYDIDYFLDPYRIEPSGFSFDPMLAMKLCYPELDKGLDFTTSIYTNIPYYKDEGKTWKKKTPDRDVWIYNCKDVWATPKVAKAIKKDLTEQGLLDTYYKRVHQFLPIALEMQRNRLKVNQEWHGKLAKVLSDEREKVHQQLASELGGKYASLNVKSSPQIQQILYEDLRLPVKHKRGTGKVTTEENILKELRASVARDSHPYRVINSIIAERHLRTRESNYIKVPLDPDGHWPFQILINNDKTGRWESKKSPKWRGCKAGHIPKVMRLMFEPPEGRLFVQRDLSQAEVRYVGAEARCLFLINTFKAYDAGHGDKIHKVVAARLWNTKPKQDSIEYDAAKSIVHAYDYMMGYKRLATEANLELSEAERAYKTYGSDVPEIPRWWQRIKDEATRLGHLTTPTGRIRQCFAACAMVANTGQLADEIWRDLVSWKPQSTIPDILNEGLYKTWEELEWVLFHQQGHDSHLDSIPPGRLTEYAARTEVYHRITILVDKGVELTIPSELSWGYLWGAMKPYEEDDKGTREEWLGWCEKEQVFSEEVISKRLYAMF